MRIVYPVHQKPLPASETWIRLEIDELRRKGHKVDVIPVNTITRDKVKNADFIYCHFANIF